MYLHAANVLEFIVVVGRRSAVLIVCMLFLLFFFFFFGFLLLFILTRAATAAAAQTARSATCATAVAARVTLAAACDAADATRPATLRTRGGVLLARSRRITFGVVVVVVVLGRRSAFVLVLGRVVACAAREVGELAGLDELTIVGYGRELGWYVGGEACLRRSHQYVAVEAFAQLVQLGRRAHQFAVLLLALLILQRITSIVFLFVAQLKHQHVVL